MRKEAIIHALFLLSAVMSATQAAGQSPGYNYVMTETPLDEAGDNRVTAVEYMDGLGRTAETVTDGLGTDGSFAWSTRVYDIMGRVTSERLPGVSVGQPDYKTDTEALTLSRQSNGGDQCPFTNVSYDYSGRETVSFGPGLKWRQADKHAVKSYSLNTAGSVRRYSAPPFTGPLTESGFYPAGELSAVTETDEDGRCVTVFTDLHGRHVLTRRNGGTDTYYVHDGDGRIRFVLTPMYQDDDDLERYAYEYRYDAHGRCVWKRLPGCEPVEYWYDSDDRLAYMRDGVLRAAGRLRFFLYDGQGRQVVQGNCSDSTAMTGDALASYNGSAVFLRTGYAITGGLSPQSPVLERADYYDGYSFVTGSPTLGCQNRSLLAKTNPGTARGLNTGSVFITAGGTRTCAVTYYDTRSRAVDVRRTFPGGETLLSRLSYSFTDKPVREVYELRHSGGTDSAVVIRTYSSVNDALLHTDVSCDGGQPHRVSSLTYDGLGRVVSNTLPGAAGAVTYSYNVRGWPTAISHGLGNETLSYTDGPGTPLYSGDVSSMSWISGTVRRGYKYTYDSLGRLSSAAYGEGEQLSDNTGRYSETGVTYNSNGALTGLRRYGRLNTGGYGLVDDLTVTLDGDRVDEVSDAAVSLAWTGSTDFKEGDGGCYAYDGDGRLTYDPDKEASFDYDLLGHPCRTVLPGMELNYIYGPGGEKLEERVTLAAPPITPFSLPLGGSVEMVLPPGGDIVLPGFDISLVNTTRYCGPFVLRYGILDKFLFDGGYYAFGSPGDFHYYLRDHLGSNRVVVSEGGAAEQVTHYYPLGGVMGDISASSGLQPWKFSGKEEVSHGGLNLFDFGARLYDPALGVWTSTDPHAEDYYDVSPYVYGRDNPIRYIDPDGKDDWDKIMGYIIGTATNVIPSSGTLRDLYTPTDAGDYNTALHNTDNAFTVVGEGMSNAGKGGAAIGALIVATAGVAEVGSGGTATIVSVPAAAAGSELTEISVATGLAGNFLKMNAAKNKSDGYNRGAHNSSTKKSDRHYNQKKKEIHTNRLNELKNQRNKLRNMQRTPEIRNELNQLEKQIKHEERKSHDPGETHHRR